MATHLNDPDNQPFDPSVEGEMLSEKKLNPTERKLYEAQLTLDEKDLKIKDLRQSLWVWRAVTIVAVFTAFIAEIIEAVWEMIQK